MKVFTKNNLAVKLISGVIATSTVIATNSLSVLAQSANNAGLHPMLQQAQKDLPANYFIIYAIVDRIARANNLDNKPWRVMVTPNYVVNAYASDTNLLTFEAGLLDQLEGNSSAIACAVAHEMGHHTKQHLGYGPAQQEQAKLQEIERLEREQLIAEQDAQTQALLGAGVAAGATTLGQQVGGVEGQVIQAIGLIFGGASQQKAKNIDKIKAQIEQEAVQRYNQKIIAISQNQELEADELGYLYSVKAGFKPDGCIAVMDILGRMPGAQMEGGSHPAPEKRTKQINALISEYPPEDLKAQGQVYLDAKPSPLSYQVFSYQVEGGQTLSGLKVFPITGSTKDDLTDILNQ